MSTSRRATVARRTSSRCVRRFASCRPRPASRWPPRRSTRWPAFPRVGTRPVRPVTAEPGVADQLAALRRGDEQAFRDLVAAHQSSLLRLAMTYAPSRAVAEEVVQETWLAVLGGLDGFEGRASLRTWMARILVDIAQRRSGREARSAPFSSLARDDAAEPRSTRPGSRATGPTPATGRRSRTIGREFPSVPCCRRRSGP